MEDIDIRVGVYRRTKFASFYSKRRGERGGNEIMIARISRQKDLSLAATGRAKHKKERGGSRNKKGNGWVGVRGSTRGENQLCRI